MLDNIRSNYHLFYILFSLETILHSTNILYSFFIVFIFSSILSFSNLLLLELIQQLESGKRFNLVSAFFEVVSKDLIKTLPITFIWVIIWFILTAIEALLSKMENRSGEFSAENAAKTLAGYERFSLSRAFFEALQKGVRMIVFLILPAIAWEDKSPVKAIKKGLGVLKTHLAEFTTGFALTELAATIVFLPPGILFVISDEFEVTFPDFVWYIAIIYCAFAWSFSLFLEQMFAAELYLWHLIWEKECSIAKAENRELPKLREVKRPSVLDDVSDLLNI
ncbi:MAG: hypothetical protein C5S48_02795 [Candidatus Methanogaster sp.]|nr:MAG: hypothetical protein C5S48_02795 [ANME-2 cluster archaeon]